MEVELLLGAQDLKKSKLYAKIGKEVVSNPVLAAIREKAKELDVPKDIVERNIKNASEKSQEAYIEKLYEAKAADHDHEEAEA